MKGDKQLTEDDVFQLQGDVQKLIDKFVAEIDGLLKAKEQELSAS